MREKLRWLKNLRSLTSGHWEEKKIKKIEEGGK